MTAGTQLQLQPPQTTTTRQLAPERRVQQRQMVSSRCSALRTMTLSRLVHHYSLSKLRCFDAVICELLQPALIM